MRADTNNLYTHTHIHNTYAHKRRTQHTHTHTNLSLKADWSPSLEAEGFHSIFTTTSSGKVSYAIASTSDTVSRILHDFLSSGKRERFLIRN